MRAARPPAALALRASGRFRNKVWRAFHLLPFLLIGGFDSRALYRSRRELSNAYLLAKFGFDTAENEPSQVCPIEQSSSFAGRELLVTLAEAEPEELLAAMRRVEQPKKALTDI